ncbi:MAG: 23S rRNA (guanosine(2251)-2'-O)-methyltransferase RlmB [Euryarchaeota archaeon]|nr:23S rRNA (guanosine(2251)-2'-O)-methyltransferase RlmB [Euryarchaeota archaeon]
MSLEIVAGVNPVKEALKSGRSIRRILLARETRGSEEILGLAAERGIDVIPASRRKLDEEFGGVHQGVLAYCEPRGTVSIEDILARAKQRGEDPLIVVLDGVEDPHNLGAVIRSAEGAGAHGVIIPERGAAGLTPTVVKSSAGATEYVLVSTTSSVPTALRQLKRHEVWIAGVAVHGKRPYFEERLTGPLALVLGSEGSGMGRLSEELCDLTVYIPMSGHVGSLNVSNAAAVLLYERVRQTSAAKKMRP